MLKKAIVITAKFTALHNWMAAPPSVDFLAHSHRHTFHVMIKCFVNDSNRELEFFTVQNDLYKFLRLEYEDEFLENKSCEMMCNEILEFMEFHYPTIFYVSVFEDGENGAEIWKK